MSTSDLYILNRKSTQHIAEFRNGWGSAPLVWDYLGDKYIDENPIYSMSESYLKKVWALHKDSRLEEWERIPLLMTFDKAYVPLDKVIEASVACLRFNTEVGPLPKFKDRVNHWASIGNALAFVPHKKLSRFARGVVLSPMSVSDSWGQPTKNWLDEAYSIYDLMPHSATEGHRV